MNFEVPVPGVPGAVIRLTPDLPDWLPGSMPAGLYSHARENELLIVMSGVARYLVRNGISIHLAPVAGADEGAINICLQGSARSALIHQRGELPLHASTLISPHGKFAVALCGSSGAGKSTLAAELIRRNWLLLADDTTRVTWSGAEAIAWPSQGRIKLWRDACDKMSLDTSKLKRVREGMEKFVVPVPSFNDPQPLFAAVELEPAGAAQLCELDAMGRIESLCRHTFRPRQIRPLCRLAHHMRIVTQVAGVVRALRFNGALTTEPAKIADMLETRLL